MDNNKIQKISHYIIVLLLVILWFIMMFFPENMDTMNFKIFFSISLACAMIYSFCRKKYFPMPWHLPVSPGSYPACLHPGSISHEAASSRL